MSQPDTEAQPVSGEPEATSAAASQGKPGVNYLNATNTFASWALTLDHKRIAVMYLVAILSSFFLGGVFALVLRTELWTPGQTIMTADTYNKMFTLHGAVMIFLFIIPCTFPMTC